MLESNIINIQKSIKAKTISLPKAISRGLLLAGKAVEKEASDSVTNNPRSGKRVTRYTATRYTKTGKLMGIRKKKRTINISRKGAAPAGDIGNLVNSSIAKKESKNIVSVAFRVPYAKKLEQNPKFNRPFLEPALRKKQKDILAILKKEIGEVLC